MTKEDKVLLLKDLCCKLPYGVKCDINGKVEILNSICDDDGYYFNFIGENKEGYTLEEVKPYLFPLSSMTKEQQIDLTKFVANGIMKENIIYDWYNKNHFDYRGLIEKGLAIDATNLNIY